jgi:hypothetical protein
MGQNLLMHGNRQARLLVAFTTDFVAIHFQQEGVFGGMGQMASGTITNSYRTMNIRIP